MENNFKLVLNDKTEIKYFNNLYSIKEYLKNNKWYKDYMKYIYKEYNKIK